MTDATANTSTHEARAYLIEDGADHATIGFRDTSYRVKLRVLKPVGRAPGKRVKGVIRAEARRIDPVGTGGAYIEPVYGTPTRIAGRVAAVAPSDRTITVLTPAPFVVKVPAKQDPGAFVEGDFVTMNLMPGASFTPTG